MKLNWKVRFKNKTWVMSFCTLIVTFIYSLLGAFEIVPGVDQSAIIGLVQAVLVVLSGFGLVQDPTTAGLGDSKQAMTYTEPKPKA